MNALYGKRVLLVEDETGLQITLQDRLSSEGYEVSVKGDGVRGEEAAKSGEFDLIILDIMLPGRDGYTVCRNLRQAGVGVPILMLTARNNDLDTVMGLRQGADDYLGKPFDMGVLIARMEALLRRARQAPPGNPAAAVTGSVPFGSYVLDLDAGDLTKEGIRVDMNGQEYRLLAYMATHSGKVLTREVILDEVWGYENDTTTRTVDVHVSRLRQRLGESELPRHIHTIRGRGYRFDP